MSLKRVLFLLVLVITTAFASEKDTTLTVSKVLDLAIKQGTATRQSLNQIDIQNVTIKQAKSEFLPSLSTSASTGVNGKFDTYNWSSSAGASVDLSYSFTPSSIQTYQAAKIDGNAAQYQFTQKRNETTQSAITAYVNAVYAAKKIDIVQNDLNYQKSKLQEIEEYRTAGKNSISDVLQQQTAVAEDEANLLQAQQTYGKAMLTIYNLIGLPLNSQFRIDTTALEGLSKLAMNQNNTDSLLTLKKIPQIQSQDQSVEAAKIRLNGSKMDYWPTVSSSFSGDYNSIGINGKAADPTGKVTLSLSFPIFDKFDRQNKVQKSILDLKSEQLKLEDLEKSVSLQYAQTNYDLEMAKKQLSVSDVRLTAAKQSLDAVTQRYNAGSSTLVEVAMVNSSYMSALDAKIKAESDIVNAFCQIINEKGNIYQFLTDFYGSK